MLANKSAIIYGGGGVIGGAVAREFARKGAKVFLAGRTSACSTSRTWALAISRSMTMPSQSSLMRRAHFITAKAVAWHMAKRKSGVILTLSTPGGYLPGVGYLGVGVACAAIEGFLRLLACELAPSGIRVNCLRPHALPEALALGSHGRAVFQPIAERTAFMASDKAGAMTGRISEQPH
jgi:NAD(P)-dependent dehydrogenase (short-subunit alcohol dehydrogenase family)